MEKYYKVLFDGKEFDLPKASIGEGKYVAVFDAYSNIDMSRASAKDLTKKIRENKLDEADVIITAEVKGAAIAQRVADSLSKDLLVFRKNIKINFEKPIIAHVKTFTSGTNSLFIDEKDLIKYSGKKAIFVDDVISTGSTIFAIKEVLDKYKINLLNYCCVFKESNDVTEDIIYVDYLPIFAE